MTTTIILDTDSTVSASIAFSITWQDAERARQMEFVTLLPQNNSPAPAALRR